MFANVALLLMFLISTNLGAAKDQTADYYFMLGEKYLLNEDSEKAKINFEKAAKIEENSSFIHMKLSETYQMSGDYDSASTELEKAIELDPSNIIARMMYIEFLITEKNYKKALENCEYVLSIDSENRDAVSYKVAMLIKLKRTSEAEKILKEYRSKNPNDEFPYFYSGIIYQLASDTKMAEKQYKTAVEINPSYEPAIMALIAMYKKDKDGQNTIKKLEELVNYSPELIDYIIKLSVIEGEKSNDKNRSQLYYNKAVNYIDKQLKESPCEYSKLIQKAMILDEASKTKEALTALEETNKCYPEDERILYYMGAIYDKLGQKTKAATVMKKVIELNPENAEALNYVAYNNITENPINLLEAESFAERALKLMPDSYQILDTMGWVLYKKGETEKAKKL